MRVLRFFFFFFFFLYRGDTKKNVCGFLLLLVLVVLLVVVLVNNLTRELERLLNLHVLVPGYKSLSCGLTSKQKPTKFSIRIL
eukprot:SAG11_NODE_75_length_18024_cov_5.885356_8_plen_83_part_00